VASIEIAAEVRQCRDRNRSERYGTRVAVNRKSVEKSETRDVFRTSASERVRRFQGENEWSETDDRAGFERCDSIDRDK